MKKRSVSFATYQKWLQDFDRELKTLSWLECDTTFKGGKKIVTQLRCSVCSKFESRIEGRRNYSAKWIRGADSVRTSSIRDHANSDQHLHATSLLQRECASAEGRSLASFAPIAKALSTIPEDERVKLRYKFDLAYFISREKLSFRKYPQLVKLEARHGVNIGTNYVTETSCREFTHYIADSVRQQLCNCLSTVNFFSLLLDGSTDCGNIDNELFLVVWFDKLGTSEKVCTKSSYFQVCKPNSVTAEGMLEMVQIVLGKLGVQELDDGACSKLVGFGTDG